MRVLCVVLLIATVASNVARADNELGTVPAVSPAAADESLYSCKQRQGDVEITFKSEMELKDLLTWVVGFTCKKFVLDPKVVTMGRKVTLIAPGKLSAAQAYDVFLTALGTMGFTVVPKGKLLMVTESATGRGQTLEGFYDGKLPADSETMVRYLLRPQFVSAETVKAAVTPVKSDAGDVAVIGSMLLLTDHGSSVRDMAAIAKIVDVPGGADGVYAIPVHHADATKLKEKLVETLDVTGGGGVPGKGGAAVGNAGPRESTLTPTKLVVDERTNTLLVTGTEAAFRRVQALVEGLDISLEIEGGTSFHVYQVNSAVAEELAKTLNDAIAAQQQGGDKAARPGGDAGQLQGPVHLVADGPTNKLLVTSSGRDFLAMRDVIRELDVPKRQVYIEAVVLEVQTGNGLQVGTSSHGGYSFGNNSSVLVGGVQAPNLRTTTLDSLLSANGLIGGLVGKTLEGSKELLGTSIPSYAVLFQALADTSKTNILSTMPILVVDNGEAKYKVGTNVPYLKGVLPTSSSSSSQLTTNIEREPLLLEMQIKPHISTDDSVLLDVKQSSKDIGEMNAQLGPTWTERGVETRVLVKDQQTIVIGGLMQVRDTESVTKVPLLGDIPLLGHLFKYTTRSKKKMNLLIMLTPYIIKDHLDLEMIRTRKEREYEEFAGAVNALDGKKYMPRMDYRRKRGLVEEINRAVQDVEEEAAARAALKKPAEITPGLIGPKAPGNGGTAP
ncbi:MAG TPA: type II secretion system secretin GspD [Kofleriaceae bacterium]|jgi:general secretion pathway protein D|nr:type II secretion system secretin GspD [Kofleriaceae bacterium]